MWGIENGKVVFQSRNNAGVWQGDPLGAHCMGLAYLSFFQLLVEKFKPGSAFEVGKELTADHQARPLHGSLTT